MDTNKQIAAQGHGGAWAGCDLERFQADWT